ncbi:hypothetical protein CDL12_08271 [Handroanthus impetiginosus]|uniref:Uncharacterized protein n=1 Tax=Handroanthus impetiginosus TaxID=429701 RepID=A0A2G9HP35_9LAMI|nr:hypothetical protein CDL12_08271 [Handroanthus impetiginosus]
MQNSANFLKSLVRRMLQKMKSYPLLFVEVLFCSTRKDCHLINCGSMLNELNSMKKELGEGSTRNGGNGSSEGQEFSGDDDDFAISSQKILTFSSDCCFLFLGVVIYMGINHELVQHFIIRELELAA